MLQYSINVFHLNCSQPHYSSTITNTINCFTNPNYIFYIEFYLDGLPVGRWPFCILSKWHPYDTIYIYCISDTYIHTYIHHNTGTLMMLWRVYAWHTCVWTIKRMRRPSFCIGHNNYYNIQKPWCTLFHEHFIIYLFIYIYLLLSSNDFDEIYYALTAATRA